MAHNSSNVNYYNSPTPYGSFATMSGGTATSSMPSTSRMAFMQSQNVEVPQRQQQHWSYHQNQYNPPPLAKPLPLLPFEGHQSWGNIQQSFGRTSAFIPNRNYAPQPQQFMNTGNIMPMGQHPLGSNMEMYSGVVNLPQYIPSPVMRNPFHLSRATGYGASSITPSTITSTRSEYDEDFSEKLIAYARFNRNTNLIKEILSEVVVPGATQIVTSTRIENLRTQVRALEGHTAKMQKEIEEMSEKYRKKREDFKASCARFHATYPRECKRKTFTQRSLERIEAKWYHRFKTEHPRNWARYLAEPGPMPKSAVFVKPMIRTDQQPVQQIKPALPINLEHQQQQPVPPTASTSTPFVIEQPGGISDFNFHCTPDEEASVVFEGSSLLDPKDTSFNFDEFDQEFFNQPELTFKNSHKNPLCGKDLLISGSENYLRALLNRGTAPPPRYNNQGHPSTWPSSPH